jgi:hypothetical protein
LKRAETQQQKDGLKTIKTWIRDSLRRMIPDLDREIINEDVIADLLPDDLPGPSDSAGDDTDLGGRPVAPEELHHREISPPMIRVKQPGDASQGTNEAKAGGGKGDTTDPKKGDGQTTGGRQNFAGGETPPGGNGGAPRMRINLRSYASPDHEGTYHLIARAESDHAGELRIDAVTEDGAAVSCPLAAAYDQNGESLTVAENKISGVKLSAGEPLQLRIVLKHPARVALRASTL